MAIGTDILDQFPAGRDPDEVFALGELLDDPEKALSERILNAELEAHLGGERTEAAGRSVPGPRPPNRRKGTLTPPRLGGRSAAAQSGRVVSDAPAPRAGGGCRARPRPGRRGRGGGRGGGRARPPPSRGRALERQGSPWARARGARARGEPCRARASRSRGPPGTARARGPDAPVQDAPSEMPPSGTPPPAWRTSPGAGRRRGTATAGAATAIGAARAVSRTARPAISRVGRSRSAARRSPPSPVARAEPGPAGAGVGTGRAPPPQGSGRSGPGLRDARAGRGPCAPGAGRRGPAPPGPQGPRARPSGRTSGARGTRSGAGSSRAAAGPRVRRADGALELPRLVVLPCGGPALATVRRAKPRALVAAVRRGLEAFENQPRPWHGCTHRRAAGRGPERPLRECGEPACDVPARRLSWLDQGPGSSCVRTCHVPPVGALRPRARHREGRPPRPRRGFRAREPEGTPASRSATICAEQVNPGLSARRESQSGPHSQACRRSPPLGPRRRPPRDVGMDRSEHVDLVHPGLMLRKSRGRPKRDGPLRPPGAASTV